MASPVLLNFLLGVLLALSQRRHCEETQIRLQFIKQASERASGLEEPGNHREKSHNEKPTSCPVCVFLASRGRLAEQGPREKCWYLPRFWSQRPGGSLIWEEFPVGSSWVGAWAASHKYTNEQHALAMTLPIGNSFGLRNKGGA